MMKQDQNFRLPKQVKMIMASTLKEEANQFKSLMIEAIIAGSKEVPREKKKNKNKNIVEVTSESEE